MFARRYRFWFSLVSLVFVCVRGANGLADDAPRGFAWRNLAIDRDWPWWRGPFRNGVAPSGGAYPARFSDMENVVFKTPLPGRGHSSPIVVGERVYLATADEIQKRHSVLALDRTSGAIAWQMEVNHGGFPANNHSKNTEATPTLACDGERLFVALYNHDSVQATALDLNGKPVWQKSAGPFRPRKYEYGYAPSPLLYKDVVIIAAEYDGEGWIAALDRKTGNRVWKIDRGNNISFSSPVVGHVAGRDEMFISGADQVASFDPDSGKKLWSVAGTTAATCGTLVWESDIVVASGGYPKAETLAVRAGAKPQVLWKNKQKCYEESMLIHEGHVYAFTGGGVMYCWRLTDGKEMWAKRLEGPVSSSPVLAGGLVYWANERGAWYVFRPTPEKFDLVAENQLGDEAFPSPAAVGGRLFIRTATGTGKDRREFLYCFGK